MRRAVLGLGANLGEPRSALRAAVAGLEETPGLQVVAVSGLWSTAPVGGPDQPEYLNAVVEVRTGLAPEQVLAVCAGLEAAAHRVRDVRWGPRTLDVDVLDIEGVRRDDPELAIPHPRAHVRAFVLAPWAEVDPQWMLEPSGAPARTVSAWLADLVGDPDQAVSLADGGAWWR